MATPCLLLLHALEVFDAQTGIAIRVESSNKRHILIRHLNSATKMYSCRTTLSPELVEALQKAETSDWSEMIMTDLLLFQESVDRCSDIDKKLVGE